MRVLRSAAVLVVLSACDPVWSLRVHVVSPTSEPLPGSAVAIVCPEESDRAVATHAALTDSAGTAELGGGAHLPAGCSVSVAKAGYRFTTLTLEGLCGTVPFDECDRSQRAEVVLQPLR